MSTVALRTAVSEIKDFFYDWVNLVLNVEENLSCPIVFSHQNAPRPESDEDAPYLLIHRDPLSRERIGWPTRTGVDETSELQSVVNDYEDVWTFEEVNGDGDRLRILIESQDKQGVRDSFRAVGLAFRGQASNILPIREVVEDQWYIRHSVDLRFGVSSLLQYKPGWIDTVLYDGDISGRRVTNE